MEGGQGWLLTLLLRKKKPLYHAALALSVHHCRTAILAKISDLCQVTLVVQQEMHLKSRVKLVNMFAQGGCQKMDWIS